MGNIVRNILNKIKNYYSWEEPEELINDNGDTVRKVKYYTKTDEVGRLPMNEEYLNKIKLFKLPFDITIDNNGDIIETYRPNGHPYSWEMHKQIFKATNQYTVIEDFRDSNGFSFMRVFEGQWIREFHFKDMESDKFIYNYIKQDKNKKNYVITPDTDILYKTSGKRIFIRNPMDAVEYIPFKEMYYNKRKVFSLNTYDYHYYLGYVTSLYPYNDGLQGNGLLNMDNNNIYDCDLETTLKIGLF